MQFINYLKYRLDICKDLGFRKLALLPLAFITASTLILLSKIMKVKVYEVQNSRIGHFTVHTELTYLSLFDDRKNSKTKGLNIYTVASPASANYQLQKMFRRNLLLISGNLGFLVNHLLKRILDNQVWEETYGNDRSGLIAESPPSLFFTPKEFSRGTTFLKTIGLTEDSKFVCLNVRDNSYLQKATGLGWTSHRDWSHHDYRDSEISTYVAAAETLAEMGYTVFRMGAIVKEPLVSKHPRVIDYATNGMRTEFLDVYLGAKCKFCISTGNGWDSIPQIFRRPSMYVNLLPYFSVDCVVRDLTIYPKVLIDFETKSELALSQIVNRKVQTIHNGHDYKDGGVTIRDLSSEELVEAVTEMARRVEGTFVETPQQKQMQAKLKHIFSTHPELQPSPNYYPIRAEFASCFLSHHPHFLD